MERHTKELAEVVEITVSEEYAMKGKQETDLFLNKLIINSLSSLNFYLKVCHFDKNNTKKRNYLFVYF